ncbi:MAG TPA: ATP-grasp domain-containing protein [Methanoregulaceae archaeon]|nr:ATP-grasp domain-containing protein [Methanoregulaceae archaeon]
MIAIVPKPTDSDGDNSTAMVVGELKKSGISPVILNLDEIDPFSTTISGMVIWVCGLRQDEHQFEVLNALSVTNRVINSPESIFTCASKVKTSALLLESGIRSPKTIFTASRELAGEFISSLGRAVYKPVYGYDGNGICLIYSPQELGKGPYYLQEYIPNDRDYRIFVIDGEAVGAIVRQSDSLAHNIHQGGFGKPIEISDDMDEIAGAAADAVGVDYGGVDLLDDGDGYTVLEVNGTPNWHCMSAPIPRLLAEYLIRQGCGYRR